MLMTSNRSLEDWGTLVGDVPSVTAILDRPVQQSEVIQMTGKSYRLRGSQRDQPDRGQNDEKTQADSPDETN
jgi:DNA replication protein DnaC